MESLLCSWQWESFLLVPAGCCCVQHLAHSYGDVQAVEAQVSSSKLFQSHAAREVEALGTAGMTTPPGPLGRIESVSQGARERREAMQKICLCLAVRAWGEVPPPGLDFNMPDPHRLGGSLGLGVSRHSARPR